MQFKVCISLIAVGLCHTAFLLSLCLSLRQIIRAGEEESLCGGCLIETRGNISPRLIHRFLDKSFRPILLTDPSSEPTGALH